MPSQKSRLNLLLKVLLTRKNAMFFEQAYGNLALVLVLLKGSERKAFKWLNEIQTKYMIPAATEVALPRHVESCLNNNIKFLWIGARTTTSPFAVQEIANSLKGVEGVTVYIKNPINAELKLWIGAFERF